MEADKENYKKEKREDSWVVKNTKRVVRNDNRLLDCLLVIGIIILASNNLDGWGWLLFFLFVRND